ncbi:DUF3977 family protein [Paenibacillus spongiae]|uniref:DUF3977 family protein n=1 Tax=Paenibacillus spongiae TaxID=2909671 RepID=UPI0035A25AA7
MRGKRQVWLKYIEVGIGNTWMIRTETELKRGCCIENIEMGTNLISNSNFHHALLLRPSKQINLCE